MRWLGVVLVGLVGCEPLPESCEVAAGIDEPRLELGTGMETFDAPIEDGQRLQVAYGLQGGQHLWLSVRTHGLAPGRIKAFGDDEDPPRFVVELLDPDGARSELQVFEQFAMMGDPDEATLSLGTFFVPGEGIDTPNEGWTLRANAEDVCGNALSDEHVVTLLW